MGARRFLGQFGNDTTSLALNNLPPHTGVKVSLSCLSSVHGMGTALLRLARIRGISV